MLKTWACSGAIALLLPTIEANATTWRSEFECFVQLHYSQLAYGRGVSEVMAHIGVEQSRTPSWMSGDSQTLEWADVQDIKLGRGSDAFRGFAVLKGTSGKTGPYFKNFAVQYWVRFEDGSSIISPPYAITVESNVSTYSWDDYQKARSGLVEEAEVDFTWNGTGCKQVAMISIG